jgi:hypothetical protein
MMLLKDVEFGCSVVYFARPLLPFDAAGSAGRSRLEILLFTR